MQYLYLILCKTDNDKTHELYKIGVANDVESRLAQLQTGSPFELEIMECYGFDNAEIAERAIHQAFTKERVRGEWFELGFADVRKFTEICGLLGGQFQTLNANEIYATAEEVEEAEEVQKEVFDNLDKWDFAAMFADGWRMEKTTNGRHVGEGSRYWCWRKGTGNKGKKYIYGGVLSKLPHPIEEMKTKYSESERTI